ncbi:MAG: hypothetical protein JWN46_3337 [Acidimicrobiales bacterium]|nr:hypothetical protein [Acidimicrobiales bacterium]
MVPEPRVDHRRRRHGPGGAGIGSAIASCWSLLVLTVIVGVAAWIRLPGLTSLGLWRDDAWTALAAHVDVPTALRMSVTTPGFTLAEAAWIRVGSGSSTWAQVLPLLCGIAGVPLLYLMCRHHRLDRRIALLAAGVLAVSPIAVTYSVRVKQYGLDLLLAVVLLTLAELARTRGTRRSLSWLAAASLVALACSAAVAPIVAGTWVALLTHSLPDGRSRRRVAGWGAVALAGTGVVWLTFYRQLSPALSHFWDDYYLDLSSPSRAATTASTAAARLLPGLVDGPFHNRRVAAFVLAGAVLGGALAGRRAWASIGALAATAGAASMHLIPLGTGRTDEVLYPPILLLAALALATVTSWLGRRAMRPRWPLRAVLDVGASLGACVLLVLLWRTGLDAPATYPGTDMRALRQRNEREHVAGDLLIVDSRTRYLWALDAEPRPPELVFGGAWLTGFSVRSRLAGVFVQPSYSTESGFDPAGWARRATGATRVEYLGASVPGAPDNDPSFQALLAAGWHVTRRYHVVGGFLVILDRTQIQPVTSR